MSNYQLFFKYLKVNHIRCFASNSFHKILSILLISIFSWNNELLAQSLPIDINSIKQQVKSSGSTGGSQTVTPAAGTATGTRTVKETAKGKTLTDSLTAARKSTIDNEKTELDSATLSLRKKIFGYSIFNNKNLSFEANLRMPSPRGYILGADDELLIDINGYSEAHYNLTVTSDGFIKIPLVGNVFVSGLTIEEAKTRIINRLSQIYVGLKNYQGAASNTTATVSLGTIRTIRVTVQGEVINPGTYSVPSLAKVMNVLYQAGGPNENGTFRDIKVIRNKRVVAILDLYDFLTSGIQRNDIALQDQDIVKVGVYKSRIEIEGKVKKPAIFEILPNESLEKIINEYAGGFTPDAYRQLIKVLRYTDTERKLTDLSGDLLSSFMPKTGDLITVDGVLVTRFENVVTLSGAVFRPGKYSVSNNQTLVKLIKRADGFREDAFLGRISITRLSEDLHKEEISINYQDIISGKTPDLVLKREDNIVVYSKLDLEEDFTVRIQGAVNMKENETGYYPYVKNMTVEDVILKAGGLSESAATGIIEVVRRKKNVDKYDVSSITPQIGERKVFAVSKSLSLDETASKFVLEPFDEIFLSDLPLTMKKQQYVKMEGQVILPGQFALISKEDKISDLIARAGGLNAQAYPAGATLIRKVKLSKEEVELKRKQQSELQDNSNKVSVELEPIAEETDQSIGIDLIEVLKNPDGLADLLLQDGDIIRIPKEPQTVRMQGELLYPTSTRYLKEKTFKDYIAEAGGFTSMSARKRAYVIYANGSVDRTRSFLGIFSNYPKIEPGSEIVVPKSTREVTPQQVQILVSTIAGTLGTLFTIYGILRLNK
ncbi:SLBB domain-containing protein [Pseudarcicella hirudinis]|uniref:SLBB domain-containing protein n=1 Tax=Pseudarcicella hirudinis TaxID=1079859 RepID=UPI0035E6390A